jgi:hypothetical protein
VRCCVVVIPFLDENRMTPICPCGLSDAAVFIESLNDGVEGEA